MYINRYSSTIILYANNVVLFENDQDPVANTRHCLIYTIIYDFIYQMM